MQQDQYSKISSSVRSIKTLSKQSLSLAQFYIICWRTFPQYFLSNQYESSITLSKLIRTLKYNNSPFTNLQLKYHPIVQKIHIQNYIKYLLYIFVQVFMVVGRKTFNLHWLSSILLVSFAGVLYRFRSNQQRLMKVTLEDFIQKFWYKPEWMLKTKNQNQTMKFSFKIKEINEKQKAKRFLILKDYYWYRKLAKITN